MHLFKGGEGAWVLSPWGSHELQLESAALGPADWLHGLGTCTRVCVGQCELGAAGRLALGAGWFLEEGGMGSWLDRTPPAPIPTGGAVRSLGTSGNRWQLVGR